MGRRVLVVEDSRLISSLVTDALVRHGYACAQAFDGLEALRQFREDAPDALVLDLNIPGLHGLEVLRAVKRERPHVVVIVLTGHGSEQTALRAVKLGADDYLTKPFREDRLVESLQIHLPRADLQRDLVGFAQYPSHEQERELARVFFNAPAPLIHADASGAIRAVNHAAARLLARSPEQLLGRPVAEIVPEDVRTRWFEAILRDADSPQGYQGEVHLVGPAGAFPANVCVSRRPDGEGIILALQDLTRQKTFEKRYFEAKHLASLGRVVEGVAHEVRNPLSSIGGFARKLRESSDGDSLAARYLDVIVAEVQRLEKMVRDIEDYVQFSSRKRQWFAPVDLARVLAGALETSCKRAQADGIQVHFQPPPGLPPVYADDELLRELFHGLVENSCEAMSSGGELTVELQPVDSWVQVRVEDTGVGIPEEDLDAIFDPFYTSKTSGAGLGLAKAYLIVEEHSGTIDFQSQVGAGTRCTVCLPVDRRRVPRGRA